MVRYRSPSGSAPAVLVWPIKAEEHSHDASPDRSAWNADKEIGTKRPLTQKQIRAVRVFLDRERRLRDRAPGRYQSLLTGAKLSHDCGSSDELLDVQGYLVLTIDGQQARLLVDNSGCLQE